MRQRRLVHPNSAWPPNDVMRDSMTTAKAEWSEAARLKEGIAANL